MKNEFAIFNGPLRFNNPKHVNDLFRTLFFFHNRRARALNHHEIGQDDGDWKPTPQKMHYEPTEMDKQFARQAREGVADGDPGRAAYNVDESRTANRKQNWTNKRRRLAQHVTYRLERGVGVAQDVRRVRCTEVVIVLTVLRKDRNGRARRAPAT